MFDLVTSLGIDPARLVKATFEPNLLLLFLICAVHSVRRHGASRTAREFGAGFLLTALAESTGVLSGAYVYPGFQLYVAATPVGNPASWVALVYVIMTVTDGLVLGRKGLDHAPGPDPGRTAGRAALVWVGLACIDASLAVGIDLVLDPLATIYNWWIWVPAEDGVTAIAAGAVNPYNFDHHVWMVTPDNPVATFFAPFFNGGPRYPTRLLGIPLINFIAWFAFVFAYTLQTRWVEGREGWTPRKKAAVLFAIVILDWPIMSLILISPNL